MTFDFAQTFFILGPTASGKSEFAAELAARCDAEIVGADAFQIYEGLPILTAKPSAEIFARTPHHLIGEIPLTETCDVARYAAMASARLAEIHSRGRRALVVGGTGLYVRALTHGLADLPPADSELRARLDATPLEELVAELRKLDPIGAERIDLKNPRRVVRAVEVSLQTGRPFSSFRDQWTQTPTGLRGIVLTPERETLNARINRRTEAMFDAGVEGEVAAVREIGTTAQQAIGFRDIRALLAGEISRTECIAVIQLATRRYAKRQQTWFRRETAFEPIAVPADATTSQLVEAIAARAFEH